METELWPNLIHFSQKNSLKIILANARLSDKSFKGYQKIKFLTRPMLQAFSAIACQSKNDAKRFLLLGANEKNIFITASIKFDLTVPDDLVKQGRLLRSTWDFNRPTWIAASTHQGEEEIILKAHQIIQKKFPNALLILVPRHPERFREVKKLCQESGFKIVRRTQGKAITPDIEVFLGDSLGELYFYYAIADLAFVGGSLIPKGGHNLLEPAALGLPVISGPHLFNFKEISEILRENAVLTITDNAEKITDVLAVYFNDEKKRHEISKKASELISANSGALEKHLALIKTQLPE